MEKKVLTITREELREKLARRDGFRLVMTLGELAFQQKHIPGSLRLETKEELLRALRREEEIVVYCTNVTCRRSVAAYHHLVRNGYTRVRRYADGLSDWEEAGLPLEGDQAGRATSGML